MSDYMVRAYAAGGMVRAFAVTTGELCDEARSIHSTSPVASAALGRLLTAGVMMGAMMKDPQDLLTLKIDGNGPLRGILVTADCQGNVKGYPYENLVILPPNEKGKLDVSGALGLGVLSVISDIGMKEPYVGQVQLVSGEIAEDIAYYYANSEQVPSAVGLGVLIDPDSTVHCAGGFIVQLMPGCPEETLSKIEERIGKIDSVTNLLASGKTPEDILTMILGDMDLTFTDRMECRYACNCSKKRVARALLTLGKTELQGMIDDGKPVECGCHFCGKKYSFSPAELEVMLKAAEKKE